MNETQNLPAHHRMLNAAAEQFASPNVDRLDIKALARTCKVTRATIYNSFAIYGKDAREAMRSMIIEGFLKEAEMVINLAVDTLPCETRPVQKLTAVLRGALYAFREHPLWGRVVLRHLDLTHPSFTTAGTIFGSVDRVIAEGIKCKEIQTALTPKDIRYTLFFTLYGLLRVLYLGDKAERGEFTETDVHASVLYVLAGFCSPDVRLTLEGQIRALHAR